MQRRIWESIGGQSGIYQEDIAIEFGKKVGWYENNQWQQYQQLDFTTQAKVGHLPAMTGNGVSGKIWGGVATIAGKLKNCGDIIDRLPTKLQNPYQNMSENNAIALAKGLEDCQGCYLKEADLQGLDLRHRNLNYADLRGVNLSGAILGATQLKYADLRGANLTDAILRQANITGANFDNADLSGADLSCGGGSCTNIQGASLQNANLTNANLACLDCNISGTQGLLHVNLSEANLTNANIDRTSLKGVNLCQATLPSGEITPQGCKSL